MIHNLNNFVNESLGSSLNFSAHGWWGKEKNLSAEKSVRPKVLGAKPKQAGKKEGGWGEGGFGGNSAFLLPNQNEASPATLQFIARHHRKILFSLGEKEIRRAQIKKCEENFFAGWRTLASGGGAERQSSQSGFSAKKVRILTKRHRFDPPWWVVFLSTGRIFDI